MKRPSLGIELEQNSWLMQYPEGNLLEKPGDIFSFYMKTLASFTLSQLDHESKTGKQSWPSPASLQKIQPNI